MKRLRGLLCVLLALCLLPVPAGAAGYSGTGSCGEDLTWSIADKVLTIRGTGEMDDHAYEGEPGMPGWDIYSFTKIVIEEGVTSIGACAFSYEGCPPVTSVELPSTLESIYYEGFRGCDKLVSIELPEGLTYIGAGAFQDCAALKEINIPDSVTTLGAWFLKGTPLALGSASAWARSDIQAADRLDLIPAECSFNYQRDVTREQIAALAVGVVDMAGTGLGIEVPENPFTDVEDDDWSVLQAAKLGIVDGVGDGRFDPEGKATREQIAAILCRAAACLERDLDRTLLDRTAKLPDTYTDRNQVSAWAADDLAALVGSGIMGGTAPATLSPQSYTTIQEAVVLMLRLLRFSSSTPAKHPAGERFQLDRAEVLSADYEIAQGIMAPNLGQAEVTGEQLDELIAAYNRACLTSERYDPVPGDSVTINYSHWLSLHLADGSEFPLCHRSKGEVRVWGEGEGNMILRSLELYELLEEIVCPPDDPAGS